MSMHMSVSIIIACMMIGNLPISDTKVESVIVVSFFFQAEDGIRDYKVTGVQTCALPISPCASRFRPLPAAPRSTAALRDAAAAPDFQARSAAPSDTRFQPARPSQPRPAHGRWPGTVADPLAAAA